MRSISRAKSSSAVALAIAMAAGWEVRGSDIPAVAAGIPEGGGGYPGGGRRGGREPEEPKVDGKKILTEIATKTGGQMFEVSKKETIEADLQRRSLRRCATRCAGLYARQVEHRIWLSPDYGHRERQRHEGAGAGGILYPENQDRGGEAETSRR